MARQGFLIQGEPMGYIFMLAGAVLIAGLVANGNPPWIGLAVLVLGCVTVIYSGWGGGKR